MQAVQKDFEWFKTTQIIKKWKANSIQILQVGNAKTHDGCFQKS